MVLPALEERSVLGTPTTSTYVSKIKAILKTQDVSRLGVIELNQLFCGLDSDWNDRNTEMFFQQVPRGDDGKVSLEEFVDWLFHGRQTAPAQVVETDDDFKACSLSEVPSFCGLYVGIETEDDGAVSFEMAVDSTEFIETNQLVRGIVHWKSLDDGFWFGKRAREFLKGQVANTGTFRVAGDSCSPASGMIECCIYVLQLSKDGSKLYGTFGGASGMPFVLQRLPEAQAVAWRVARAANPDCDDDGELPMPEVLMPACPRGHVMQAASAFFDGHPCDACRAGLLQGTGMFDCDACNYGLCLTCAQNAPRSIAPGDTA